jgi:hypothetical protein
VEKLVGDSELPFLYGVLVAGTYQLVNEMRREHGITTTEERLLAAAAKIEAVLRR